MKRKRNLLLVSHDFPPFGGSGVQRALKFAKYLPNSGWRVHVLTAGHRHYPLRDESLLAELGEEVIIHRVNGWDSAGIAARLGGVLPLGSIEDRIFWRLDKWMSRWTGGEPETKWTQSAIRAAVRIIRDCRMDAVMTTSPPHGVQRVGMAIQRRFNIPWVADLRDPIVDNFTIGGGNIHAHHDLKQLEWEIIEQADCALVTCDDLRDQLATRYTIQDDARILTLTNGFDADDAPPKGTRSDRFVLGYIGSFYRDQSIRPLLEAARTFLEARPDARGRFEIHIAGSISSRQKTHIRESDRTFLRELGYLSHAQALRSLAEADALFLMTPTNQGGRYCIPAKTFEYLAFGGPILALVHPDTHVERLLADANGVTLVRHGEIAGLERSMAARFDHWLRGETRIERASNFLAPFRRDGLSARLADILNRVGARIVKQPDTGRLVTMEAET